MSAMILLFSITILQFCMLETYYDYMKHVKQCHNMGSSKKSCSKGIQESCGLPGAKRIFAMEY